MQKTVTDLENIFENITFGIIYEQNGIIVRVNTAIEKLLGFRRTEVIGQQSLEFKKTILEGSSDKFLDESTQTFYLKKKNGEKFWATLQTNTFHQDDGVQATVWTIEDVSRQRDAELRLRQMSLAVDQSSNSVVITDTNGIIQYVNSAFIKTTGYTTTEVIGKNPSILQSGKTPQHLFKEMWQTITSGMEWSGQFINRKKNDEIYEEHVTVAPIRDEQGQITHYIATKENITELKKARKLAEQASKAKGEFLAYMSHEIRTPLNVIIGMTGLVLETELNLNQNKFLKRVKSSADNLLSIVNDILDYSKIEAGMLTIEQHPFSLVDLVHDIRDTLSFLAEKKGVELMVSMPQSPDISFTGDRLRIHQVLFNLVGNGIKFTENGKVELAVNIDKRENDQYLVSFQVKDTGIGIRPESVQVIFDSFVQADHAITRNFGGTGLGLSICNQLVQLMGGTLEVQSVSGLGSRFSFSLILPISKEDSGSDMIRQKTRNRSPVMRNVLLVEDSIDNQDLATAILKEAGHRVTIAVNGLEALEMLAESNEVDVVLMDVQMPVLDGLTATRCIRNVETGGSTGVQECEHFEKDLADSLYGGHLHIIAMTANVMLSDKERCREAGVDDFLAKPYSKESLLTAVQGSTTAKMHDRNGNTSTAITEDTDSSIPSTSYTRCLRYILENFDLDKKRAESVLDSFISSLQKSLGQLVEAVQVDDRNTIRLVSHKIKGSLYNINCNQWGEIASNIENGAHTKNLLEIQSLVTQVSNELRPLLDHTASPEQPSKKEPDQK